MRVQNTEITTTAVDEESLFLESIRPLLSLFGSVKYALFTSVNVAFSKDELLELLF